LASQPKTVPLSEPVEWAGMIYSSITLQAVRGRHLRSLPIDEKQMNTGTFLDLASRMSGVPGDVFDLMCADDVRAVIAAVAAQINPSLAATGAAKS